MTSKFYIGIDIGATNTKFALLDASGNLKSKRTMLTTSYGNAVEFAAIACDIVSLFIKEKKIKKNQIRGIGLGAPGAIDVKRGIINYLTNVKGWKNIHLKKLIESKLGIPTYLDNDANVMALGEFVFGSGRGAKNIIGITLGSGVGGGLILDGHLYRGANFAGGEIGHIPISLAGDKCPCGGRGCLEVYVGNKYIVKRYVKEIRNKSQIQKITPKDIYERAKKGERAAIDILNDTGTYLGIGLSGVVNLLNPEKIVIGGGVANAGKFIFDSMRRTVKERAMKLPAKTVKIVKAKLGEDAGVIGAAALAMERLGR